MVHIRVVGLAAVGIILALVAVSAARPVFTGSAEKTARIAAFPITERTTATINLLLSHPGGSSTEINLPDVDCTVHFNGRYVETVVRQSDAEGSYGLFIFESVDGPPSVDCRGAEGTNTLIVSRSDGEIEVSVE